MNETKPSHPGDIAFPIIFGVLSAGELAITAAFLIDILQNPNPIGGAVGMILALIFGAPVVGIAGIIEIIRLIKKKVRYKIEWILAVLTVLIWVAFFLMNLITAKTTTL